MKPFVTVLAFAFFATARLTCAETNALMLCGEGKNEISEEMIGYIKQVAGASAENAERLWVLYCHAPNFSGPEVGHTVSAYFVPRVASARLLRGKRILCTDATLPVNLNPGSRRFGGWYSHDKQPTEYGIVAPIGQSVSIEKPPEKPFRIIGVLPDADVTALYDTVRLGATNQWVTALEAVSASHVIVHTALGTGTAGLLIDLERNAGTWSETQRRRWVQ